MNTFNSRSVLRVGKREFEIYRLDALEKQGCSVAHLPYSLRILLENLLRREDGKTVKRSEEHTSELQSLRHLVCRLLLEKKTNMFFSSRCSLLLQNLSSSEDPASHL